MPLWSPTIDELEMRAFTGTQEHLELLWRWKADSNRRGGARTMQRQFRIELRVDFADPEKLEVLKQTLKQAALHALATARLISDNPKSTQVAVYSDDFFTGHEEIQVMENTIQNGLDAIEAESGSDGVSDDLANAFR